MKSKANIIDYDLYTSLKDLKEKLNLWIAEFEEEAIFQTDANYEHVRLVIDNRKGSIESYNKKISNM